MGVLLARWRFRCVGVELFHHIGGFVGAVFKRPVGKACLGRTVEGFLVKAGLLVPVIQTLGFC